MAIENIHYAYDHMRFYRSALRPVFNDLLFTKGTINRDNKKLNWSLRENAVAAVKSFLTSKNIFIDPSSNNTNVL